MADYIKIRTRTDEHNNIAYTRNVRILDDMPKLCDSFNGEDIVRIGEYHLTDPEQPSNRVWDFDFFEITTRAEQRDVKSESTTTLVAVLCEIVDQSMGDDE